MAERHVAFVGTVPSTYDRYLGPLLFHRHADDLAGRLPVSPGTRVLEVACGTGIVTERLVRRLGGHGALVATDLNEAMIAHAKARIPPSAGLEWRQADGTSLPFPDRSFDAVVCQFGLMFFPDKAAGVREAYRVLRPGGTYLFNVWDAIERSPVARIAHETIGSFFPGDPPPFYTVPYGLHDASAVRRCWTRRASARSGGNRSSRSGRALPPRMRPAGSSRATRSSAAIMDRRPEALPEIRAAVARNIAAELGDHPVRSPLRAHVFTGVRP